MSEPQWEVDPHLLREAGAFLAGAIKGDPAYISHGEIQCGLSVDGRSWRPDLVDRLVAELANVASDTTHGDEAKRVATLRNEAGELIGVAVVELIDEGPLRYAVLADLAVAPTERSQGIGETLFAFVRADAKARGARWMFLESGVANERAHAFFERQGLHMISHVFGAQL